ncbi:MAG: phosphotransferase [Cyanobacteriota bacterium]|nr:phosphotransferase [Cyanobacteriota bacterium]
MEAYAPAGTYLQVRQFTTPEGAPKTVWSHRDTGELVLLGSLPLHWPEPARLEQLLPWLNALEPSPVLTLRHYLRTRAGHFTVGTARHRHFLATYRAAARPCRLSDGRVVARALAEFHRLGREAMERHGTPMARDGLGDLLDHWLLPGLEAAREGVAPGLRRAVEQALRELEGWRSDRLEALEALPTALIHGDWQAKNLLLSGDAQGRDRVHVLDSESCRVFPRLFDLYFLLSWDDVCSGWQRPDLAMERLGQYVESAGGLTDEERQSLPDFFRIKAWSIVVWSCEGQRLWRQRPLMRRLVCRNSLKMAAVLMDLDCSRL